VFDASRYHMTAQNGQSTTWRIQDYTAEVYLVVNEQPRETGRVKMQDMKLKDQIATHENVRHDEIAGNCWHAG